MGTTLTQTNEFSSQLPKSLIDLQKKLFILRPIHNKTQYKKAMAVATDLSSRPKLTRDQTDYLEVLTDVISRYEENQIQMDKHSPIEILKFLVEENNMSGSELGRILGNRTLGPAILRGDRSLSKANIRRLADHFSVNPSIFIE